MANGASDLANRLGLRGESLGLTWIKHELPQLEVALDNLTARERSSKCVFRFSNLEIMFHNERT